MTVTLHVEPRKTYSWDEFKSEKGPYSIALDGLVNDHTKREPSLPCANFDHHSLVDRGSTLATCMQVYEEINLGLFNVFRKEGIPHADVYINDPDEDTTLTAWLLLNHELVIRNGNPRLNRIVSVEDKLDRHSGMYPLPESKLRRQMAWIFEPYNHARYTGTLFEMDGLSMHGLVETVMARINDHIFNGGQEIPLEGHYNIIGGGKEWKFVEEIGPAARIALVNDNINSYIRLVAKKKDDSYVYSVCRRSPWDPLDPQRIFSYLNEVESNIVTDQNRWGGSNTNGGSPRITGSLIPPNELERMINEQFF